MSFTEDGGVFRIERHPNREYGGHPYDFTLSVETPDYQRAILTGLGKGDLMEFCKRINQALKETQK